MKSLNFYKEERAKAIQAAREILDRAAEEKRALSAEENAKYDEIHAKSQEYKRDMDRLVEIANSEKETAVERENVNVKTPESREQDKMDIVRRALRDGMNELSREERASLTSNAGASGGYLVLPEVMVKEIIKQAKSANVVYPLCREFTLNEGASLTVPEMTSGMSDADWTGEVQEVPEDTSLAFGKRKLTPSKLAKLVKIPLDLIQSASFNVEDLVNEEMGYIFGATWEKAIILGDGVKGPLGLFTAHASGISTGRDIATGNAATSITFDGLKSAKGGLKQVYRGAAKWLFHPDGVTQISKIREGSGTGQYLWQESLVAGEPDKILGIPVLESDYVPNTFTSGLYVGLLGDFNNYWTVKTGGFEVQVLNELYARNSQKGYIGRMKGDGQPAREEAFVRVKLG